MIVTDYPQGSDLWLQARAGVITASRARDARSRLKPLKGETVGKPSQKMTAYAKSVAVERIAGRPIDKFFETWQMREGTLAENDARQAYERDSGAFVDEAGFITTDDGIFGYSADGMIGKDGLLEVKSLFSSERIVDLIGERDVSDFRDQCLMGLWITNRKWIDVVLWAPALENIDRQKTVIRIERDEEELEMFIGDMFQFKAMVDHYEAQLRGTQK